SLSDFAFYSLFFLFFFFFFQAEDGIRDLYVTGVQTCALPIFRAVPPGGRIRDRSRCGSWMRPPGGTARRRAAGTRRECRLRCRRSEERRVGKEGRSGGGGGQEKKKRENEGGERE